MTGVRAPRHWSEEAKKLDLFDMKGEVESLFECLGLDKSRFISYSTSDGLTDSTLRVEIHGSYAGYLGRVRDEVLKSVRIRTGCVHCRTSSLSQ